MKSARPVASVAGAFAYKVPRRDCLVALDVVRACIALLLPCTTELWAVYAPIALLQCGSAAFTPTFQATIPDVVADETEYTRALSLSRLAYDLEALASPVLAAVLLTLFDFHWLFAGTAFGFIASAGLVRATALPSPVPPDASQGVWRRTTQGVRDYLATPSPRAVLALNLAVAASGAMVLVNTIVVIRGTLGFSDHEVAWALAAYGAGSMLAALALPRLLVRFPDRILMILGACLVAVCMAAGPLALAWLGSLLALWMLAGLGHSLVTTPVGRIIRRSATPGERPALFAAQFALSHACWLVTYPLAG